MLDIDKDNSEIAPIAIPGNDFLIVPIFEPQGIVRFQAFRYSVYIGERQFEPPDNHHSGVYADPYDEWSSHVLIEHKNAPGIPVAAARLIHGGSTEHQNALPCEQVVETLPYSRSTHNVGEMSSVCISSKDIPGNICAIERVRLKLDLECDVRPDLYRHASHALMCGFFYLLYRHQISAWFGLLRPGYRESLRRNGILSESDEMLYDVHGKRCLAYNKLQDTLSNDVSYNSLHDQINATIEVANKDNHVILGNHSPIPTT